MRPNVPDPDPRPNYLLIGFTASYDKASNRLFERHLHAEPRSHLYPADQHDSADRLLQYMRGVLDGTANPPGSAIVSGEEIQLPGTDTERTYHLDLVGNWGDSDASEVTAVTYKPAGEDPPVTETETRKRNNLNQIASQDGTTFSHDDNGNLTDDGTLTYKYDAFNRLREVRRKSDSMLVAKYVYDAQGRRVRKIVSNGGVDNTPAVDGTTDYLYSGSRCVEERDGSNNVLRQYVWGRYVDDLIQQREYDPADETRFNDFYPITDLHHRAVALTDEDGCIVETYDTDAYGRTLIFGDCRDGAWFTQWDRSLQKVGPEDPPREVPFVPLCQFIYTGRRYDSEAGLYFYRARYYAPNLGRFISRDPKNYVDGMGLYEYARSSPLFLFDPRGSAVISVFEAYEIESDVSQSRVGERLQISGTQYKYAASEDVWKQRVNKRGGGQTWRTITEATHSQKLPRLLQTRSERISMALEASANQIESFNLQSSMYSDRELAEYNNRRLKWTKVGLGANLGNLALTLNNIQTEGFGFTNSVALVGSSAGTIEESVRLTYISRNGGMKATNLLDATKTMKGLGIVGAIGDVVVIAEGGYETWQTGAAMFDFVNTSNQMGWMNPLDLTTQASSIHASNLLAAYAETGPGRFVGETAGLTSDSFSSISMELRTPGTNLIDLYSENWKLTWINTLEAYGLK